MIFPRRRNSPTEFRDWCNNNEGSGIIVEKDGNTYPICSFEWMSGTGYVALDPQNQNMKIRHPGNRYEYEEVKSPETLITDGRHLFMANGEESGRFGPDDEHEDPIVSYIRGE